MYQKYINAHYGKCTIVFDGSVPVPSTKDREHTRLMKSTIAPDTPVELENTFTAVSQKAFFSNFQNKEKFSVVKCTVYYIVIINNFFRVIK